MVKFNIMYIVVYIYFFIVRLCLDEFFVYTL